MRRFNKAAHIEHLINAKGLTPEEAEDQADADEIDWENDLAQEGKDKARGIE